MWRAYGIAHLSRSDGFVRGLGQLQIDGIFTGSSIAPSSLHSWLLPITCREALPPLWHQWMSWSLFEHRFHGVIFPVPVRHFLFADGPENLLGRVAGEEAGRR